MTASTSPFESHQQRFKQASDLLTGGVSASLRVNSALGHPVFMERGEGPYLFDVEGRRYIDLNLGNGSAILGHRHPAIVDAIQSVAERGFITASETSDHAQVADLLVAGVPGIDRVRFSTTGTEASLLAARIARGVTGRKKIIKFEGHFHGLFDGFMYNQRRPLDAPEAPPNAESAGLIGSPDDVIVLPWNDRQATETAIERYSGEIAAIICEPINYNSGCIPPAPGFLEFLRQATASDNVLLIFDEVLSGFRMHFGGAQAYYNVTPDLTALAKALAGGIPLSATGGEVELMSSIERGQVAHSGTYSGHLLGIAAARAILPILAEPGFYDQLNATADRFYRELQEVFSRAGVMARVQGIGARFGIYFGVDPEQPILTYADAAAHDSELSNRFIAAALDCGVYVHGYGSSYGPGHAGISSAHSQDVLDDALERLATAAARCKG